MLIKRVRKGKGAVPDKGSKYVKASIRSALPFLFKYSLKQLADYRLRVEDFLADASQSFKMWLDEKADSLSEDERGELVDIYVDDLVTLDVKFPEILRRSLLVTAIARLEHYLDETCRVLKREEEHALVLSDLKGSGIDRSETYLAKVADVQFAGESAVWSRIIVYRHIRNVIIHKDGVVSNKKLREKIEGLDHISLGDLNKIKLDAEFLPKVLEDFATLADELEKAFEERARKRGSGQPAT